MSYTELVLGNRFRSRVGLVREASSLELLAERNVVGSLPQNPHPVYFSKVILARATDYNGPKLAHMLFRLKGAVIRCELHTMESSGQTNNVVLGNAQPCAARERKCFG
jgi:hypothetical protein